MNPRTTLLAGRCTAVLISLLTLGNVLVKEVAEAFVVPDVLVACGLALGAALPARQAVPVLGAAFAHATGVFTVATAAYVVRGELGAVLGFAVLCLAMTALFVRLSTARPGVPEPATVTRLP